MFTLKQYKLNESLNAHTENYLGLARQFGNDNEIAFVETILTLRNARGYITASESAELYLRINPYYKNLVRKALDQFREVI